MLLDSLAAVLFSWLFHLLRKCNEGLTVFIVANQVNKVNF